MDTQITFLNQRLHLLAAPRPQLDHLVQAGVAHLGLSGRVHIIDAGNRFDPYAIARLVRRQTGELDAVLGNIDVARAFTPYQVLALLEAQAAEAVPIIVLDLLATFADENVRYIERSRLLDGCIVQLQRLSGRSSVLVTTPAYAIAALPGDFPARLAAAAHKVWRFDAPAQPPSRTNYQPPLFRM